MNDHKFAFIICTNNDVYLQECIHYLNHLIVPCGYETELFTINDAPSMTEGYQEAMTASDAKYKIYMHQDTFVVNPHFLEHILEIFHSDPQIGMIGMFGYSSLSPTGCMWDSPCVNEEFLLKSQTPSVDGCKDQYSLSADGYREAVMVDGFMMVTSVDLPWDTDTLKDWDFYDAFQCMHFTSKGYRIVVPVQKQPWCIHDDGLFLSLWSYEKYRKLFVQKFLMK